MSLDDFLLSDKYKYASKTDKFKYLFEYHMMEKIKERISVAGVDRKNTI